MAKKLLGQLKLQIPAGQANPSPPVGPALGQRGINIMEFCKAFNAKTQLEQAIASHRSDKQFEPVHGQSPFLSPGRAIR